MLNITSSSNNLMYIFGTQVRKYILGDSVLTIGKYAFYNQGDDSLRTIVLPQGLTTISAWGFGYLEHLQSIEIPANVTSIGGNAFSGCTNLRSVVIGSGVTSIASQAFRDCNSLTRVTSNAPTPPTIAASDAFSLQDTLLVPCKAKTLYQQAQFWQNFSKIICPDDMNTPTELTYTLTTDWQFITLPGVFGLSADDIVTDGDVVWATYNAERRAAGLSGWEIYSAATGFSGTKAFIVRAADANATLTIHIPDQAREPAGAALPLTYQAAAHPQNANWNFLGNPYPYEYNISAALQAQGIETPITVWNGTGYSTYTPGIDEYTLQPFQAFFIQLPDNGPETITFSSEYIAASGENDLLWDYTEAAPSANPDNGLYYASMVSDAVGTNNGLKGVKLNASSWAYFEKANVAGKLKLTFANRKVQTAYAVSVYNATKTDGENPVKGEKIADTDDVEFGSSATIALPAEVSGVYIERKTDAEGVLSKIEFKEGVAH